MEFGCSHPFVSALLLKLRAEDRAAGIDDDGIGAVTGHLDKREQYSHWSTVYAGMQDTTPRKYCSGRGKLEGWFYGQFLETLGAWQLFCLFEAAPNATHTVPLSLERGNVFLLPGSSEPAVLVAILVGSKPVGGKESGRSQAVHMGLLRESVSGACGCMRYSQACCQLHSCQCRSPARLPAPASHYRTGNHATPWYELPPPKLWRQV